MEQDKIEEVGIDGNSRLYVRPSAKKFPFMYREAVEVHWDEKGGFLYSPEPREWSYFDWFTHIIGAAKLQGCALVLSKDTKWTNVPSSLREEIVGWCDDNV